LWSAPSIMTPPAVPTTWNDTFHAVAVAADGSIFAAGETVRPDRGELLVAKFTAAGQLDEDFGDHGVLTARIPGGDRQDVAYAVAPGPNGGVVVAGRSWMGQVDGLNAYDAVVASVDPDRDFDDTFGDERVSLIYTSPTPRH
jgi:hypothetical protein